MSDVARSVKRLLRPLVPDYVMNRIRLRQDSKSARWNIDVAVADASLRRRWLRSSPDTYRVMSLPTPGGQPSNLVVLPHGEPAGEAGSMLARRDLGAAVAGEVEGLDRKGRAFGPTIAPTKIVIRPEVLEDIGGIPNGPVSLPSVLARLLDAGHHIGLIPNPSTGVNATRRDPIQTEAVVVLAAVPLHDVGGGSRGAQIAFELLRRGYHVTYVNRYPSYEDVDLGLRFVHPRLEQLRFDEFNARVVSERCGRRAGLAVVEVPEPVYGRAIEDLHALGWHIVYDVIDDWSDPSLGGEWYDETFATDLTVRANTVVASAPDLVMRVTETGRAEATLVPNAVNASVFGVRHRERPDDLPDGRLLGYHGSLYGDWFDWESLGAVARANSDASVVVIGETRGVPASLPANVVFLGLKSQSDLPAYVQFFEVGLVPFKVTETTHAVSPLKVYEYLACGVPVAAPPLRALAGIEGVTVDADLVAAVAAAGSGARPDPGAALEDHSWSARIETLFIAAGQHLADPVGPAVRIEIRPPVHYQWRDRRITN